MEKHRAVIVGAGRIGAAYQWPDDNYSHAGAYRALEDRVELVGFVEKDGERAEAANIKWQVPVFTSIIEATRQMKPDIVSVCVQPEQQSGIISNILENHVHVNAVWCEKPWVSGYRVTPPLIQVNYLRRADLIHSVIARDPRPRKRLVVYAKDDIHTRCHFEDLARWWGATLYYRVYDGPCAYAVDGMFFDDGGINPAECMKGMLRNLLDAIDNGTPLFSPPY